MHAYGFAGAGKQFTSTATPITWNSVYICQTSLSAIYIHETGCSSGGQSSCISSVKEWNYTADKKEVNGTIFTTNKLITLFVMMFCVFTGDGYLQHYRRCCRDCWPTTGYNKYQSFFYWLHFGFKGGIKSITSSFTDLYYHNLRPQFISYA